MSAEAQATLERMAQVRNVADRGEIQKPAVRLLRKRERQEREDELRGIDRQLGAPPWAQAAMSAEGRQSLAARLAGASHRLPRARQTLVPSTVRRAAVSCCEAPNRRPGTGRLATVVPLSRVRMKMERTRGCLTRLRSTAALPVSSFLAGTVAG